MDANRLVQSGEVSFRRVCLISFVIFTVIQNKILIGKSADLSLSGVKIGKYYR